MTTGWVGVDHLLKAADAAARLAVSTWTLNRLRREGHLPAIRIGNAWRYDPADISAFITNNRSEA